MPDTNVNVAISVESDEVGFAVGLPEVPKSYRLRFRSNLREANFVFQTGMFYGGLKADFELLKEHGWTVLSYESYELMHLMYDSTTKEKIVKAAMAKVKSLYATRREVMAVYNEDFAAEVLMIVVKAFPAKMQLMELKREIEPEPSDSELLLALEGLMANDYIRGVALRGSTTARSKLEMLANIESTKVGRDSLKPPAVHPTPPPVSQMNFHAPVGIVGDNASGTVTINQQVVNLAPEPDWPAMLTAFSAALAERQKTAEASSEWLEVANLAKVKEEATSRNKAGFIEAVSKLGQSALPILATAGAHGLIGYLELHFGWKLN